MNQQLTIEDVKDYIQHRYGNAYDISTLQSTLSSLESIQREIAQILTERNWDPDEFVDDDNYYMADVCIDVVNQEIAKERVLRSAMSGPKGSAKVTASIKTIGERSEGGRRRKKRTRKHKKSRRHRKTRRRY